eukprot:gene612-2043_t
MRPKLVTLSPASLLDTASGLSAFGYEPEAEWVDTLAQVCENSRDAFSPEDLHRLVCSLALLKAPPKEGLLKDFLSRTPALLPSLAPERLTASAAALALMWSQPAEASVFSPDDASPWLESFVKAVRGNIHSFGLGQLDDLTKALVELQDLYINTPGGSPSNSPLSDFLAYLREFFLH